MRYALLLVAIALVGCDSKPKESSKDPACALECVSAFNACKDSRPPPPITKENLDPLKKNLDSLLDCGVGLDQCLMACPPKKL